MEPEEQLLARLWWPLVIARQHRTWNLYGSFEIAAEMARFTVHRSIWRELNTMVDIDGIQIGMAILKVPDSALHRPKNSNGGFLTEV